MADPVVAFRERRDAIRKDMGGAERVQRLRAEGRLTARDRLDALLDPGTFSEIGTFVRSDRAEDHDATPGDGKIGGHGRIDGQAVTVAADDVTVKKASGAVNAGRKMERIFGRALKAGTPFVYLGEGGGARIPDVMGSEGFVLLPALPHFPKRGRRVPVATVIVGDSYGGPSFYSAFSDLAVQVRGTCMAVTSPRVVEIATGESVTEEELGGVDVHAVTTGQIDVVVDDEAEANAVVRRFLSYLPPNAWTPVERRPVVEPPAPDPELAALVPESRRRAYDMRKVVRRLVDDGELLELKPRFGRGLLTMLARIDGHAVGIIASQPIDYGGALGPDACDKATRMICLCDAFDIPLVFLQDTPGFFVGRQIEHDKLLYKGMLLQQASMMASTPKLTVVLRKAFGLAHFALNGAFMDPDFVCAWPQAELSFMDPDVGANVVYKRALDAFEGEERVAEHARLAAAISGNTDPYGAAGALGIDEIIDPAETRMVLAEQLELLAGRKPRPYAERVLATWPTSW
jgi:acetyl-CoA carboxylase carboxyltransferase component